MNSLLLIADNARWRDSGSKALSRVTSYLLCKVAAKLEFSSCLAQFAIYNWRCTDIDIAIRGLTSTNDSAHLIYHKWKGKGCVNNINNTIEQYKDNPSAFIAETFESSPYAISISIKNIWLHFVTHLQGISFCHWPKPAALVLTMDSNTTAVEISLSAGTHKTPFHLYRLCINFSSCPTYTPKSKAV
jgi:hypothetical protein